MRFWITGYLFLIIHFCISINGINNKEIVSQRYHMPTFDIWAYLSSVLEFITAVYCNDIMIKVTLLCNQNNALLPVW